MKKVRAFTDGSAYWKTGYAGYGAYIEYEDGSTKELSKGYYQSKIGRMESMALLAVLNEVEDGVDLTVYSDATYVVKMFTEGRLFKAVEKMYVGTANSDIWKQIVDRLVELENLKFTILHVKGHQKEDNELSLGNKIADALADYKSHEVYEKDIPDEIWEKVKSNKGK